MSGVNPVPYWRLPECPASPSETPTTVAIATAARAFLTLWMPGPAGTYPVKICVVPSEKYGDRYACVKVEVSREKPVRYELGMVGNENLDAALGDDDYFGFGVDAGMGCIADIQTQAAFKTYWAKRLEEDPDIDPYNDLFCDLLEENAQAHPKYQGDCGDWLNWRCV